MSHYRHARLFCEVCAVALELDKVVFRQPKVVLRGFSHVLIIGHDTLWKCVCVCQISPVRHYKLVRDLKKTRQEGGRGSAFVSEVSDGE